MCGSMVDIQSAAAKIRRGKKKEEEDRNHRAKIQWSALLHRATIIITSGQSNLTTGRIAAARERFNSIHHVAPVCTRI